MTDGPADAAGPATVARVLAERARALAAPLRGAEPAQTVDLVVLAIGPERYGLDTGHMVEVQPLSGLTRVPGLPPVWAGIVNLRGRLCPVLDLRRYLRLPAPDEAGAAAKVAVVTGAGLTVGLLVDDAPGIARVPAARIGPPLTGGAAGVVRGVTPDLLTVLDADDLLADARLAVREESA